MEQTILFLDEERSMTQAVMALLMAAATSVLLVLVPKLPASAVPGTLDSKDPGSRINVRSAPTTQSSSLHYGLSDDKVEDLRQTQGSDGYVWYHVIFPQSEAEGWVRGDFVRVKSNPKSTQSKFAAFWFQFKTAVAKQDAQAVASMTQLPFTVNNKPLGRAEFIGSYSKLFSGLKACIAEEKPSKDGQSYMLFCGDQGLLFKEVEGEYKFVEFFAND
jgi:hypothetical protein